MEKKDRLYISEYNFYYGNLLTDYQSNIIKKYYDEDLSLSEIGQELNITPQGVRDALKRAEKTLESYEQRIGLVKKTNKIKSLLEQFLDTANDSQKEKIVAITKILDE